MTEQAPSAPSPRQRIEGIALIKPEFQVTRPALLSTKRIADDADDDAEGSMDRSATPQKKGGMNKGRKFGRIDQGLKLCRSTAKGEVCTFPKCKDAHSLPLYLATKPEDRYFPSSSTTVYLENEPFLTLPPDEEKRKTIYCPTFNELGYCPQGFKCRFLSAHLIKTAKQPSDPRVAESAPAIEDDDGYDYKLITGELKPEMEEKNRVSSEKMKLLRAWKYPLPKTEQYLDYLDPSRRSKSKAKQVSEEDEMNAMNQSVTGDGEESEFKEVPFRQEEKKKLDWKGKTYLAPLTTVGNLPFRRLCVEMGCDITCGEMGLATSFLTGSGEEWSLVRRHPSERQFGVQICGTKPDQLVACAEAISLECPDVDFIDLNCGCPIDMVFNKGAGSAGLGNPNRLEKSVKGIVMATGSVPITIKLRTGIKDGQNIAHNLIPKMATAWGVSSIALHGRTRQQRYAKNADWNYIKQCGKALRDAGSNVPFFGNGDCFSYKGYAEMMERDGNAFVDGVMLGRGALIKPWIFTEIKERREWDITATERLEMVRTYAENALTHWGTDAVGMSTSRRYLMELLSFTHRYVPLGLLEFGVEGSGRMNDRPEAAWKGRNELETLMGSTDVKDWEKIATMFMGPPPEGFTFVPKHKSNAYGSGVEDAEG